MQRINRANIDCLTALKQFTAHESQVCWNAVMRVFLAENGILPGSSRVMDLCTDDVRLMYLARFELT